MTVYVAEEFTPDEADILRRYFTNLDGPVFALVNLPEVVKGALFARYSRSPKSLRRLFLDEFVGELDITGDITHRRHRRAAPGRGALRPGVLRVRRRLGGPARRRPPGLRAGVEPAHQGPRVGPAHVLPRAVDPLHRLRQPGSAAATGTTATPALLSSPLGTRYVGDMDRLFDTYAELLPDPPGLLPRAVPEAGVGLGLRLPPGHPGQGLRRPAGHPARRRRCRTSASTAPARATSSSCCACGPTRCPRPARYADLMLRELRKVIPSFLKRVDLRRPGRGVERLPGETRAATAEHGVPACCPRPTPRRADARRSRSPASTPTPRSGWWPRCSTRTRTCPSSRSSTRCGP